MSSENSRWKQKLIAGVVLILIGTVAAVMLAPALVVWVQSRFLSIAFYGPQQSIKLILTSDFHRFIFLILECVVLILTALLLFQSKKSVSSKTMTVAGDIKIPVAVGEGQHGTSRFMRETELPKYFDCVVIHKDDQRINELIQTGHGDVDRYERLELIAKDRGEILAGFTEQVKEYKSKRYTQPTEKQIETIERDLTNKIWNEENRTEMEKQVAAALLEIRSYPTIEECDSIIANAEKEISRYIFELLMSLKMEKTLDSRLKKTEKEFDLKIASLFAQNSVKKDGVDKFIEEYMKLLLRFSNGVSEDEAYKTHISGTIKMAFTEAYAIARQIGGEKELDRFRAETNRKLTEPMTNEDLDDLLKDTLAFLHEETGMERNQYPIHEAIPNEKNLNEMEDLEKNEVAPTRPEPTEHDAKNYLKKGGIVLGQKKRYSRGKEETFYCCQDDLHSIFLGATGSGKSRRIVLPSIGVLGLAGESIVMTDPKGELYKYTYPFLEKLGYHIIVLDFNDPSKSHRYNFLQPVIDAVNEGNMPEAENAVWDIVNALVPENNYGEKIWTNGEQSIIAACIMSVVYDNRQRTEIIDGEEKEMGHPEYQNLGNVYHFLSEMVKAHGKFYPINYYTASLPENHPSKRLLAIAEISPEKTRASFYSGALTTMRLFTSEFIQDMTSTSDFHPSQLGEGKTALFLVLPDDRATYYSIASLIVSQYYSALVKEAKAHGDELQNEVNFILDEFGNFTKINNFDQMITVARSRKIRFHLFLQSFSQIEEKYGKNQCTTILNQCTNWVYLAANDNDTLNQFSQKMGSYTVGTYSTSQSVSDSSRGGGSTGNSWNMTSRSLLYPSEIQKIKNPYLLVLYGNRDPAIMYCPDISTQCFNAMFGMGDKEVNKRLRELREKYRSQRTIRHNLPIDPSWQKWISMAALAAGEHVPYQKVNKLD